MKDALMKPGHRHYGIRFKPQVTMPTFTLHICDGLSRKWFKLEIVMKSSSLSCTVCLAYQITSMNIEYECTQRHTSTALAIATILTNGRLYFLQNPQAFVRYFPFLRHPLTPD
ncbi:hypothetical protein STEG23_016141, partial [Scotinomys teguina]